MGPVRFYRYQKQAGAMLEYLKMGGYAAYIWSAYGVTAMALGGLFLASECALRTQIHRLQQMKAANHSRASQAR